MKSVAVKNTKNASTLRRVLSYVKKYPISLIGSLLFAALSVAGSLLVPVFFGDAIDCIIENGVAWESLKGYFIKVGVSALVSALSVWMMSLFNNRISGFFHLARKELRRLRTIKTQLHLYRLVKVVFVQYLF